MRTAEQGSYLLIGILLGRFVAIATFIGCWIYAVSTYGFLLGVGLGWLPSAVIAALAYFATLFLWPLLVLAIAAFLYAVFFTK